MRNRPLPRMLDGSVRRQCGTKLSHGRMRLHPLAPSAEGRVFRIHALSFLGQSEGIRARQHVEVGQREIGPQQMILPVPQLAFQDLKAHLDFRKRMRDDLLVRRNAELGKYPPFVRHVIDHVGVVVGVDGADPLVHARACAHVLGLQRGAVERFVDTAIALVSYSVKSPCCRIGTRLNGCSARWVAEPISGSRSRNVYGTCLWVSTSRAIWTKVLRGNPSTTTSGMTGNSRGIRICGQEKSESVLRAKHLFSTLA